MLLKHVRRDDFKAGNSKRSYRSDLDLGFLFRLFTVLRKTVKSLNFMELFSAVPKIRGLLETIILKQLYCKRTCSLAKLLAESFFGRFVHSRCIILLISCLPFEIMNESL